MSDNYKQESLFKSDDYIIIDIIEKECNVWLDNDSSLAEIKLPESVKQSFEKIKSCCNIIVNR